MWAAFLLICGIWLSYAHAGELEIEKKEWLSPQVDQFDCHSSGIVETAPGHYCVVWKGGEGSGQCNGDMDCNVGVWMTLFDGSWSIPVEIVSVPHSICWNPVLCKNPEGELLLFYRVGEAPQWTVSFLKRSFDQGKHWSKEEILPAGIIGPTKNKPLFTSDGTLIAPSSVQVGDHEALFKATSCWIEISKDKGHTWEAVGPLELEGRKFGVIEPALFHDQEGNLCMMCRDRANRGGNIGFIWKATSRDHGRNWSCFQQTDLPNPDSAFDIVELGQGKLILVYNHSHTSRRALHVALSWDGGDRWSPPLLLDENGEFPSAILGSDGLVHITYASYKSSDADQRGIKHVVLNPAKLQLHLKNKRI